MAQSTSRKLLIACVYLVGIGVGVLLLIQHWVHVPQALPFLILLACPLMHLFMHRGHSHHQHGGPSSIDKSGNPSA